MKCWIVYSSACDSDDDDIYSHAHFGEMNDLELIQCESKTEAIEIFRRIKIARGVRACMYKNMRIVAFRSEIFTAESVADIKKKRKSKKKIVDDPSDSE